MTLENESLIDIHRALKHPDEDETGKMSDFARKLAKSICEIKHTDGMVIALFGGWGYGKTTVLNFIKHVIENEIEEAKRPQILDFNPWWFSESNDLTMIFFSQLTALLKESGNEKLLEGIRNFSKVMSRIPLPYLSALGSIEELFEVFEKNIYEQKEEIEELLSKMDKKILVVIDDIDRLDSNEIRQVFKLIKAVGDFPNIIYLIALDRGRAVQALSRLHDEDNIEDKRSLEYGEQYLEKIIQFSYPIPLLEEEELLKILSNSLYKDIFSYAKTGPKGNKLFYCTGLLYFLKNPRNVNRLISELFLKYPLVKSKVSLDEFILIESLRIFCYPAYLIVRERGQLITNLSSSGNMEKFNTINLNTVSVEEKEAVQDILRILFPGYSAFLGGKYLYSSELGGDDKLAYNELSICIHNNFRKYFTY